MSRKMIDYQVEEGKITSIDGYKVGEELTGAAIMGVTKDSTTITRTLDTDGKVKFDAKGGAELTFKTYPATCTNSGTVILQTLADSLANGTGNSIKRGRLFNLSEVYSEEAIKEINAAKQVICVADPQIINVGNNGKAIVFPLHEGANPAVGIVEDGGKKYLSWNYSIQPLIPDSTITTNTRLNVSMIVYTHIIA